MKIRDLFESKSAPLYHATDLDSAIAILNSNNIQANTQSIIPGLSDSDVDFKNGVSLTRSLQFAKDWLTSDVIFVLNQEKLSHNHKIIPVDYFQSEIDPQGDEEFNPKYKRRRGEYSEAEEFVIGPINNVKKYIEKVIVNPKALKQIKNNPDIIKTLNDVNVEAEAK